MKKISITALFLIAFLGFTMNCLAQEAAIVIRQDPKIDSVMKVKSQLDAQRYESEYFTVQLFYGDFTTAEQTLSICKENFPNMDVALSFETPNYKVQAGRFRNKILGLKTLDTLKGVFPGAFLLARK